MTKMTAGSAALDSRAAWIVAGAALVILMIAYGALLLSAVALRPIAAEFGTERAAPAAAGAFTLIGAAFGGIAAGWLSGWLGIRRIVLFGAGFANATSLPPLIAQVEFARDDVMRVVALIVGISQGAYAFAPAAFGLIRELAPHAADAAPGAAPCLFAAAALVPALAMGAFLAGRSRRPGTRG